MSIGKTLALILLLFGSAYGEREEPTFPYTPYRLHLQEYNSLLKREGRSHVFVTQSTPVPRSILAPGKPLELTLTFNHAIDPSTLPPTSEGWKLQSPWGQIDSENLSQFGTATFSRLPLTEDGVSYPPNTLRLRLNGPELKRDHPLQCSLWLNQAPTDYLGRPVEDFELAEAAYHQWDFRVEPNPDINQGGSQYLVWQRGSEQEVLRSLTKITWEQQDDWVVLSLRSGGAPFTLPHRDRQVLLRLPRETWRGGENLVVPIGQAEVLLTEWLYQDFQPPQGTQFEPAERHQWRALEGSVTLRTTTSEGYVLKFALDLAPLEEEEVTEVDSRLEGVVTLPPSYRSIENFLMER